MVVFSFVIAILLNMLADLSSKRSVALCGCKRGHEVILIKSAETETSEICKEGVLENQV